MPPPFSCSLPSSAITMLGILATFAWLAWRFGRTLLRLAGWCSWWVAWACGSQGGYGYCFALLLIGTLIWGAGTLLVRAPPRTLALSALGQALHAPPSPLAQSSTACL